MARILVIDNIQNDNEHIINMLTIAGYEACGVSCVKKGLALIKAMTFNLVITEILIPEKDGLELLFSFKKEKIVIPVIAISAGGKVKPDFYFDLAKMFGAVLTIRKPIPFQTLITAIKSILIHDEKGIINERNKYL
jgi:DNA-binding NtrC family response regulator